jgi:hypothetical protein
VFGNKGGCFWSPICLDHLDVDMEAVLFERIGVEFFQEICSETPLLPELCPVKSGGVSCLRGAT